MKVILTSLLTIASSFAFANPNTRYVGRDHTCRQLQAILAQDGEINIVHWIGYGTSYSSAHRCQEFPWRAWAYRVYEPSSDNNHCSLGWGCHFGGH